MPSAIKHIDFSELSLVFKEHKGGSYAPVNPDANVLTVKGEVLSPKSSGMGRFIETLKGYFASSGATWPVAVPVPDGVDGDNDGQEDYNALSAAFSSCYWDLSSAYGIMDDAARSLAIKCVFDEFLSQLDAFRTTEKAGKRMSAADQEHLDGMSEAHKKMGDHLAALGAAEKPAGEDDGTQKAINDAAASDKTAAAVGDESNKSQAVNLNLNSNVTINPELLATEVAKAVESAVEPRVAAIKAESDAAIAQSQSDAQAAKSQLEEFKATFAQVIAKAREGSASSPSSHLNADGTRTNADGTPVAKSAPDVKGKSVVAATQAILAANRAA